MDMLLSSETTQRWRRYWGRAERTFMRGGLRFEITETGAKVYRGDTLVRTFSLSDTPASIDTALTDACTP